MEPVLTYDNIFVTLPIFSKPPIIFATNATIVAIDKEKNKVTIVTDFGNELTFSIESLSYRYTTMQDYFDGFPVEDFDLRIGIQIQNLKEKREKYKHISRKN